jgi:hypothetical protein
MNFFLKIIVSGSMLLMIISAASANKVKWQTHYCKKYHSTKHPI